MFYYALDIESLLFLRAFLVEARSFLSDTFRIYPVMTVSEASILSTENVFADISLSYLPAWIITLGQGANQQQPNFQVYCSK